MAEKAETAESSTPALGPPRAAPLRLPEKATAQEQIVFSRPRAATEKDPLLKDPSIDWKRRKSTGGGSAWSAIRDRLGSTPDSGGQPQAGGSVGSGTPATRTSLSAVGAAVFFAETLEHDAEKNESHYEVPTARDLTITQMVTSLTYVMNTLTAWVFCTYTRDILFPVCAEVWPESPWLSRLCVGSTFFFWTFPLFGSLCVTALFYRDLLHIRIWYEMLAHRALLNFRSPSFLQHNKVRLMFLWLLLGACMYPFAGKLNWASLEMTLPYWFPALSLMGLLYTNWDLETRLLSLTKFVEEDPDWAKQYHTQCYFIQDHIAAHAFHNMRRTMQLCTARDDALSTPSTTQTGTRSDRTASEAGRFESTIKHRHTTGGMIMMMLEEATRMQQRGEEVKDYDHGYFDTFRTSYWVRAFLHAEHLEDERAARFVVWYRVYTVYSFILLFLCSYLFLATTMSHMIHQGMLHESFVTRAMSVHWLKNFGRSQGL